MINSVAFDISFTYKGKQHHLVANKMFVEYSQATEIFYRIPGKKYNPDIHKVDGVWQVHKQKPLPEELLQIMGEAIDVAEAAGLQFSGKNKAYINDQLTSSRGSSADNSMSG